MTQPRTYTGLGWNKPTCKRGHPFPESKNKWGNCRICSQMRYKEWVAKHPESRWGHHYKSKFGVTKQEFLECIASQKGRCAICKNIFNRENRLTTPTLDHVHDETNRFRGVLCHHCNALLGLAYDDPKILRSAIRYLDRDKKKLGGK